jgi:hypothetical protein
MARIEIPEKIEKNASFYGYQFRSPLTLLLRKIIFSYDFKKDSSLEGHQRTASLYLTVDDLSASGF